jgi:hypothetical protein
MSQDARSPARFIDALKQAAREVQGSNRVVLVLEGGSDHLALGLRLSDWVEVQVAGGKETLIAAYRGLDARDKNQMVFVVDCDGEVDADLKGHIDFILTTNRDIEADLILTLGALERVLFLTLPRTEDLPRTRDTAAEMAKRISTVALRISALLLVASSRGLSVHPRSRGARSKLDAIVLNDDLDWTREDPAPITELVASAGRRLGWGIEECDSVESGVEELLSRPCRRHNRAACSPCTFAAVLIGHQAVAATVALLTAFGAKLGENEVPNLIYAVPSMEQIIQWEVGRRLALWAETADLILWAD